MSSDPSPNRNSTQPDQAPFDMDKLLERQPGKKENSNQFASLRKAPAETSSAAKSADDASTPTSALQGQDGDSDCSARTGLRSGVPVPPAASEGPSPCGLPKVKQPTPAPFKFEPTEATLALPLKTNTEDADDSPQSLRQSKSDQNAPHNKKSKSMTETSNGPKVNHHSTCDSRRYSYPTLFGNKYTKEEVDSLIAFADKWIPDPKKKRT